MTTTKRNEVRKDERIEIRLSEGEYVEERRVFEAEKANL